VISVDHEVAAVLPAAALSIFSAAQRPDSPLFNTPAIDTTSSLLSGSSIKAAPAVARLSPITPAASFGNVGGVGKVPPVNTRPAPAIVSKVEFDGGIGHSPNPPAISIQLSAISFKKRRQNTEVRRQNGNPQTRNTKEKDRRRKGQPRK
jgi:hypothetical protein